MARLPLITRKDQVAEKDRATVDAIVASRGALQGPFTMFLHCPELAGRLAHLGAFARFEGSLDMRVRVLAAMTVAREFDLSALVWVPSLLFALHAGMWADRRGHRRATMIAADLRSRRAAGQRSGLLCAGGADPRAAVCGRFRGRDVDVLFTVSDAVLLVSLVPADRYVECNSLVFPKYQSIGTLVDVLQVHNWLH